MRDDLGNCDYCGAPVGFYGCPKHGTDCYCEHLSLSGDEGPIAELDRMPTRWRCDECGTIIHDEPSKPGKTTG